VRAMKTTMPLQPPLPSILYSKSCKKQIKRK
jgi:hypothetical protein